MKKLEELGISPAPWEVKHHPEESSDEFEVFSADGKYVGPIAIGYGIPKSMANFIAAAPKLYDKAYEVAENLLVHLAIPSQTISMNRAEVAAMVNDLRSALAEAAGESEAK